MSSLQRCSSRMDAMSANYRVRSEEGGRGVDRGCGRVWIRKRVFGLIVGLGIIFLAIGSGQGCANKSPGHAVATPPATPSAGPNWAEIDQTVARVKARERAKRRFVEVERTEQAGFSTMTEEEYAEALEVARAEIRKEQPGISDKDLEAAATRRADAARQSFSHTRSASSTYQLK